MQKIFIIAITLFIIPFIGLLAQEFKISTEDIILLKKEGFSDSTLNKIVSAKEIKISVEEIIKLKKAEISDNIILKMAILEKIDNENEASKHTVEEWLKQASNAWNNEEDIDKALEYTQNAYTLDPNRLDTNFNLAVLFTFKLHVQKAINHYEKVNNIEPSGEGNLYLGILYLLDGQKNKGYNQFKGVKKKGDFEKDIIKALKKYTIENISDSEICFKDKKGQIKNYLQLYPDRKARFKNQDGQPIFDLFPLKYRYFIMKNG